jgi:hypothetical protein
MTSVTFSSGTSEVTYGPFDYVRVGFGELFVPSHTEEGEIMLAKVYGTLSHTSPAGIIVTDGITVTGADKIGVDIVGWVPHDSTVGYLEVSIFTEEDE